MGDEQLAREMLKALQETRQDQQAALEAMRRVEDLADLVLPLVQLLNFRLTALIGVLAADGAGGARLIAKYNAVLAAKTPRELLEADAAFARAMSAGTSD
ncbi:MAG: hypothetical protein DYH14_07470 [Betaproteobacteria bacterium PRO3]|nr:hypothetical protein [Betaproteobacteria bacterium PRO3]